MILDSYEVSVLGATTGSSLIGWLDDNGYRVDVSSEGILSNYIVEGWNFVAVKILPGARRRCEGEFLPPLAVSYATQESQRRAVFPMRISGISTTDEVRVTLYVVAESTLSSSNYQTMNLSQDPRDRSARRTNEYLDSLIKSSIGNRNRGIVRLWAGEYSYDVISALKSTSPLDRTHPRYLTRLETLIRPTAATPDIILVEDEVPELFRIVLRYRYDPPTAEEIGRRILLILFCTPAMLRLLFLLPSLIVMPILIVTSGHRDEAAMITLCHRSGYMGFSGPLLALLLRGRTSAIVRENCRRALNFQLSLAIYALVPFLTVITIIMIDSFTDVYVSLVFEDILLIALFCYYWIHQTVAFFSTFAGVSRARKNADTRYMLAIPFIRAK